MDDEVDKEEVMLLNKEYRKLRMHSVGRTGTPVVGGVSGLSG